MCFVHTDFSSSGAGGQGFESIPLNATTTANISALSPSTPIGVAAAFQVRNATNNTIFMGSSLPSFIKSIVPMAVSTLSLLFITSLALELLLVFDQCSQSRSNVLVYLRHART